MTRRRQGSGSAGFRRPGTTLVEVLVAIFIMGIGMLALLTLFPIGVLRMAQAINTERAAQAGFNAHENSIIYNVRNDPVVISDGVTPDFFVNPNKATLKDADPFGESYAILVDPLGSGAGAPSPWVGNVPGILRRRPTSFANPAVPPTIPTMYRSFTLWDDMVFSNDVTLGMPGTPELAGVSVMRNTRFSWAYTLRRPVASDRSVVEGSVVVFDSRSLSLAANLTLGEFVYNQAYFNPVSNTVVIDYSLSTPPPIRPGSWIMDATQYLTKNPSGVIAGAQHAYWYRVLSVTDVVIGVNTYAVYEIQGQIRGFGNFPTWVTGVGGPVPIAADPTTGSGAYPGTIVVLDGVAEVFDKGPVRTQ